ncbi:hypothetical protein OG840_53900 [Streptomyces sp. NBC_01764]|uniref:hypothetical protein n=1 Tax=Streptomyces sp. NBC_01764 TaxID=2975935 RepID=UPI002258A13E|nr:hypothetical protein [Streptomyces sp. NBC_01764]MCX4410165.1 hypothetical protein [Streptomyces sp. NBC_01764]
MELLSTLTRRQHEHRARTVSRLTALLDADLLPADLQEMVLYYRAKALRDTGRAARSRRDYQQVADQGGRLAPAARRGLAHAARLAGDFPTALVAAQNLGWEGRHQRVLGDLYWLQGQPERAAAAYLAGRIEAEQHGKAGEAAHSQALRAFAIALYAPAQATAEIDLAHQLLAGLNLRATTINVRRAELIRDAGSDSVDDQIATLRTELDIAGLTSLTPAIELACAFHQAVLDDHTALHATLARLREQTTKITPTSSTSPSSWPTCLSIRLPESGGSTVSSTPAADGVAWSSPGRRTCTPGADVRRGAVSRGKRPPFVRGGAGQVGFSGVMPVPAYSSGSSDRTVSGSPAFTACQAIAAAWATGQSTLLQSIASTA